MKKYILIGTLILFASCAVPEVIQPTNTPQPQSATPVPAPTQTPGPVPTITQSPIPTQTSIPNPAAIIAKLDGGPNSFILVGGSQNGNWINSADMEGEIALNSEYQILTAFEFQEWTTGNGLVYEPICDDYYETLDPFYISQSAVGVSGEWDVMPRIPQEISTDSDIYLEALAAWLVEQAPSQPVVAINKIWKVDLDGDGADEVFINATRYTEPTGHNVEPHDYSVVLMRTVLGSDVVTVKLIGDYYSETVANQFPMTYNLEFIGDLNADGQMEVVVGISRWESSGAMVFEIDGEDAQLVLSVMCSH